MTQYQVSVEVRGNARRLRYTPEVFRRAWRPALQPAYEPRPATPPYRCGALEKSLARNPFPDRFGHHLANERAGELTSGSERFVEPDRSSRATVPALPALPEPGSPIFWVYSNGIGPHRCPGQRRRTRRVPRAKTNNSSVLSSKTLFPFCHDVQGTRDVAYRLAVWLGFSGRSAQACRKGCAHGDVAVCHRGIPKVVRPKGRPRHQVQPRRGASAVPAEWAYHTGDVGGVHVGCRRPGAGTSVCAASRCW